MMLPVRPRLSPCAVRVALPPVAPRRWCAIVEGGGLGTHRGADSRSRRFGQVHTVGKGEGGRAVLGPERSGCDGRHRMRFPIFQPRSQSQPLTGFRRGIMIKPSIWLVWAKYGAFLVSQILGAQISRAAWSFPLEVGCFRPGAVSRGKRQRGPSVAVSASRAGSLRLVSHKWFP